MKNKKGRSMQVIKRRSGFTFMEMMIAVTIFSIIAVAIYYTLHTGIKLWKKQNEVLEANQAVRIFFDSVYRDVVNTVPLDIDWASAEVPERPEFAGQALTAVTLIPYYSDGGTVNVPALVSYGLDGDAQVLTRTCRRLFFSDGAEEPAEVTCFLRNVSGLQFQYAFKSEEDEAGYEWKDMWDDEKAVPKGIRVTVSFFSSGSERVRDISRVIFLPAGKLGGESEEK